MKSKLFDPNFPFSPRKFPFYYGWVIFLCSIASRIISVPGHTVGICAFTEPLMDQLGISRVALSNIFLFSTLAGSLCLPIFGKYFDKIGLRQSAVFSAIILSFSVLFLGSCKILLSVFTSQQATIVFLFIGFFALKLFGQSLTPLTSRVMLLQWYDQRSCTMIGLTGIILSFAFGLSPQFTTWLIHSFGTFSAWTIMGLAILLIFTPFIWATCRQSPEEFGLKIDGNINPVKKKNIESSASVNKTLAEALHSFDFWIFVIAAANTIFLTTGLQIHIVDIFREAKADTDLAFKIFLPISLISAFGGLILSWIQDRISIKYCLLFIFAIHTVLLIALEFISTSCGIITFTSALGINWALYGIVFSTPWAKLFGRKHLNHIMSVVSFITIIATSLAPSAMSYSKALTGSYFFLTRIVASLSILLFLVSVLYIKKSQKK